MADGWPNLCAFLGVPIPTEHFPHSNTTTEFRSRSPNKLRTEFEAAARREGDVSVRIEWRRHLDHVGADEIDPA